MHVFSPPGLNNLMSNVQPVFENIHRAKPTVKQLYLKPTFFVWNILSTQKMNDKNVFIQVVNLVYNINQAGKSRKYTKEEYLYINEASIQSKIELCEF